MEILWALYLKLLCGEILAHVYSVEPEILMLRNDNTLQELTIL
ncbi:hypothetical protein [Staphylococcus aureus]